MRYHKSTLITRPEADFLIRTALPSISGCSVISHAGKWYDTRRMNQQELADFMNDLKRTELAEETAGLGRPH